jgi:hypothetical protein
MSHDISLIATIVMSVAPPLAAASWPASYF